MAKKRPELAVSMNIVNVLIKATPRDSNKDVLLRVEKSLIKSNGTAIVNLLCNVRGLPKELQRAGIELIVHTLHPNPRWIFPLLSGIPDFPEDLREKAMGGIIFSRSSDTQHWIFRLLSEFPNIPEGLMSHGVERNHEKFEANEEVKDAINFFLRQSTWLIDKRRPVWRAEIFTRSRSGIPIFGDIPWYLTERSPLGALIGYKWRVWVEATRQEERQVKVVLLPDVSHKDRGYAVEVGPEINTVHEAIAWMYRQDPKEFNGFDIEV